MRKHRSTKSNYWFLIYIFLALTAGILIAGFFFFSNQWEHIRSEANNSLIAIGDLKADQIISWRQERMGDAVFLSENIQFARQVKSYFRPVKNEIAEKELLSFMQSMKSNFRYESILLFDISGKLKLSSDLPGSKDIIHLNPIIKVIENKKKVLFSDIHSIDIPPYLQIDIAVPIFEPGQKNKTLIGVVLLQIDPNKVLFPMIQSWPTPSSTSETLLLEQEGDSIIYLNELRHRKNTALKLRLPVSSDELPAAMAVRGKRGIVEGKDYRNIPVLAVIRHIPDFDWYMISKIDVDEIYAPLRTQTWIAGTAVFFLILATAAMIGLWWRHQRSVFYRQQYISEVERQAVVKHLDYAIRYANDIILLINPDGKIVEANEQACKFYGYTREELYQLRIHDLRSPRTRTQVDLQMKRVADEGGFVFETEHMTKDGKIFPVEVSSRVIKIDEKVFYQSIIRDITERKRNENTLKAAKEYAENLIETANTIVVGLDTKGNVNVFNKAAESITGYTRAELMNRNWFEVLVPRDRYPDVWKEFQRLIAGGMPKNFENPILTKTGEERYIVWSNNEIYENGGIAGTISFGLDLTERKRAEKALQASEAMLIESQRIASLGHYELDIATGNWTSSKVLDEIFGIGGNFVKNIDGWLKIVHPEDHEEMSAYLLEHVIGRKSLFNKEYRIMRIDNGAVHWLHGLGRLEFGPDGKPAKMFGTIQDITEHKQVEEVLLESEETFHALLNAPKEAAYLLDVYRNIIAVNNSGAVRFGKSESELIGKCLDNLLTPELRESRRSIFEKIIKQPQPIHLEETQGDRYLENSFYPIYDLHGKVSRIAFFSRDITERRQAEESVREINERLNTIIEAAPLAIYALDLEGHVQKVWNTAAEKLLGWKKEEVLGKFLPSVPEEKHNEFLHLHERIKSGQPLNGIPATRIRKDGSMVEYSIFAAPLHNQAGKITGNIVLLVDLTEQRKAEEALRQSEALFKMLVESSPVAIAVFSGPSKKLEYVSSRFTNLFGYELEDLSSMDDWWKLAYPAEEYRNQIEIKWCEFIERAQREGIDMEPMESVITCKNGTTKYAESTFNSIGDQTLMFFTDLTQRRIAEESLRQTHTFNELLIQTLPFGIDIVDEQGNILFMSKSMTKMFGSDYIKKCCWDVYKDDKIQCSDCPLKNGITYGKPEMIETSGIYGGRTFQISHVGIVYEGQKAMLEIFQDVTEQKRLQQELMQSQKLLSIGTMAGGIAHDFNNILAIILGYSSIMISIKDNPQRFSDGITAIRQAVDRGAGLVRQILTFARKTDISFQPLSIPDLVKELVSMLQQTFPKIITFDVNMEKQLPYINADHTQMHQAILNLCVNARDAMPEGGKIIINARTLTGAKTKETFSSAADRWYIWLSVSDTGMGMEENIRAQIFDPFFTTKEKGKGTGLGLSVVFGIIQAHQGFINVESSPGKGTTFNMYLPIPRENKISLEAEVKAEEVITGGTEGILFVEDESLLLDMIQILLESNGYRVFVAKDGQEAIDIYSEHIEDISIVVSDMGLPKLSGLTEFEKLKEINPKVKIIFASGYFEPDMRATLEKAGARGFLQKPYVMEDILSKIRKVLDAE